MSSYLQDKENERRKKRRFQIEQDLRYKIMMGQRVVDSGFGRTLNMSSGGIWFNTHNALTSGMPVELSINWPALLNETCPMKLTVFGRVLRSNDNSAAVAIERYEFRTQGSPSFDRAKKVSDLRPGLSMPYVPQAGVSQAGTDLARRPRHL